MVPRSDFWLRRLHSLTGIVPIGAFLCEHFYTNAYAVRGPAAYDRQVEALRGIPIVLPLEIGLIWLPIAFHALLGIRFSLEARPNLRTYNRFGNWMYFLQRMTGIFLVVFIAFHMYETRFSFDLSEGASVFRQMQSVLANPLLGVAYALGVASAAFHFGNGIWSFLIVWGITIGPGAQRVSRAACLTFAAALFVLGMAGLWGFYSAPGIRNQPLQTETHFDSVLPPPGR